MAELTALILSPAAVHERACQLTGRSACWHREAYCGGLFSTEHFRVCSFCSCIHPGDLIDLLHAGGRLECSTKPGKLLLLTPNPIAGELVPMGTVPGHVFDKRHWPLSLKHQLCAEHRPDLRFEPTIGERLSGHFDRPALEQAPAEIIWPFYSEHATERHWPAIWAAANHGVSNAEVSSA